jgi:hypothetical protein
MKIVSFAMLLAVFVVFLSCSGQSYVSGCALNLAAKQNNQVSLDIPYDKLDPSCMDEQRKLVLFIDLEPVELAEIDWDYVNSHLPGYVPGTGMVTEEIVTVSPGPGIDTSTSSYKVNGVYITEEEYIAYKEGYRIKYAEELNKKYEELNKNRRTLEIPCVVDGNVALLTDEDISELMEKYDDLAIEEYIEAVPAVVNPPADDDSDEFGPAC